jgi:predicted GIY-YIG superfamily endonuclease
MPGSENSNKQALFYVYILESMKYRDELYVGFTANLKERLAQHNDGLNESTK